MSAIEREVVPAVLASDLAGFERGVARIEAFAKTVQLDIVDGVFDQHVTWPYVSPGAYEGLAGFRLPHLEKLFWEVDLMGKEPREIGLAFVQAGASRIIAHVEAFKDADEAREAFEEWQKAGAQAGVSLLLDTPVSAIEDLFYDVQMVQVMGIATIGAQGLPFDERAIARVRELREHYPEATIAVDGGVTVEHAVQLMHAGANRLVVGSAIMKAPDARAAYEEISEAVIHTA